MELHGTARGKAAGAQVRELLELVGISGSRADRYPARVLGRHAAAGCDRAGAGLRAEGAARRRADHGARRDGAGADPGAAGAADARAGAVDDPGHARPAGGGPGLRPGGGDVCRRDRRDGRDVRRSTTSRGTPTRACCLRPRPTCSATTGVVSIPGAPPRLDRELVGCPFQPRCDSAFAPCAETHPRGSSWSPGMRRSAI